MAPLTPDDIWAALHDVHDPEIPVVSVVDLGMIREVEIDGSAVRVRITPTYTGCPAQQVMTLGIVDALRKAGAVSVQVETVLDPPWTTDWITENAREKLRAFGLAVSERHGGRIDTVLGGTPPCPFCGSPETAVTNPFGTTKCKSICVCRSCRQPFQWIKPL